MINHSVRLSGNQRHQQTNAPTRQDVPGATRLPSKSLGQKIDSLWVELILHYIILAIH